MAAQQQLDIHNQENIDLLIAKIQANFNTLFGGLEPPVNQTFINLLLTGLLTESSAVAITAGTTQTQAGATALAKEVNNVSVNATAGNGVKLPASAPGLTIIVVNSTALPIQVYGAGADTINGQTNTVGVSQMPSSIVIYVCNTAGVWVAEGIGNGFSGSLQTFSSTDNITANATQTQAAATPLTTMVNRVVTNAAAGNGVRLPPSAQGMEITVINAHATNAVNVYGANPDVINALASTVGFSIPATKTCTFFCTTAGQWHTQLSA